MKCEKKNILVVDDEDGICQSLKIILEDLDSNFRVTISNDGSDALWKLRNQKFSLIIIDNKMPKLEGLEVIEFLRNNPGDNLGVPIILMSANLMGHDVKVAIKMKVMNILSKPFDEKKFTSMVRGLI
jgi:CheY-like chemotaxis protein